MPKLPRLQPLRLKPPRLKHRSKILNIIQLLQAAAPAASALRPQNGQTQPSRAPELTVRRKTHTAVLGRLPMPVANRTTGMTGTRLEVISRFNKERVLFGADQWWGITEFVMPILIANAGIDLIRQPPNELANIHH